MISKPLIPSPLVGEGGGEGDNEGFEFFHSFRVTPENGINQIDGMCPYFLLQP
jgi:hypothetical protein